MSQLLVSGKTFRPMFTELPKLTRAIVDADVFALMPNGLTGHWSCTAAQLNEFISKEEDLGIKAIQDQIGDYDPETTESTITDDLASVKDDVQAEDTGLLDRATAVENAVIDIDYTADFRYSLFLTADAEGEASISADDLLEYLGYESGDALIDTAAQVYVWKWDAANRTYEDVTDEVTLVVKPITRQGGISSIGIKDLTDETYYRIDVLFKLKETGTELLLDRDWVFEGEGGAEFTATLGIGGNFIEAEVEKPANWAQDGDPLNVAGLSTVAFVDNTTATLTFDGAITGRVNNTLYIALDAVGMSNGLPTQYEFIKITEDPKLSTADTITGGDVDPTLDIEITRETFDADGSENLSNWVFTDLGDPDPDTGLTLTGASYNAGIVTLAFTGTAVAGKSFTLVAEKGAQTLSLVSTQASTILIATP